MNVRHAAEREQWIELEQRGTIPRQQKLHIMLEKEG